MAINLNKRKFVLEPEVMKELIITKIVVDWVVECSLFSIKHINQLV